MKQQRKDLQPFTLKQLDEIRKLIDEKYCGGDNCLFWYELESILKSDDYSLSDEWERMENDEVVLGEVWSQPIGDFYYKNTVHRFSYLYVESQGLAIAEHGHAEPVHGGEQVRKIKEWYIFPDGRMELCRKDCTHKLVNNFKKPIYVLSLKIGSNGTT